MKLGVQAEERRVVEEVAQEMERFAGPTALWPTLTDYDAKVREWAARLRGARGTKEV